MYVASCWWSIQNVTVFIMLQNHSWDGILRVRASSDAAGKHQAGKSVQPCLLWNHINHAFHFVSIIIKPCPEYLAFGSWRLNSEQVVAYTMGIKIKNVFTFFLIAVVTCVNFALLCYTFLIYIICLKQGTLATAVKPKPKQEKLPQKAKANGKFF